MQDIHTCSYRREHQENCCHMRRQGIRPAGPVTPPLCAQEEEENFERPNVFQQAAGKLSQWDMCSQPSTVHLHCQLVTEHQNWQVRQC